MIKIKNRTKPIPPGETIKELLRDRKISKKEFAFLMKMSIKDINKLLQGRMQLNYDIALQLENIFTLSAGFWINLQFNYMSDLIQSMSESHGSKNSKRNI